MTAVVSPNPLYTFDVEVGRVIDFGTLDGRHRRCIPILGGTVSGAHHGVVREGGADWQSVGPDGSLDLEAHYPIELEGNLVEVHSHGVRHGPPEVMARLLRGEPVDPSEYYFRTALRFTTAAPALRHLNTLLAVGIGERLATRVRLKVYAVI